MTHVTRPRQLEKRSTLRARPKNRQGGGICLPSQPIPSHLSREQQSANEPSVAWYVYPSGPKRTFQPTDSLRAAPHPTQGRQGRGRPRGRKVRGRRSTLRSGLAVDIEVGVDLGDLEVEVVRLGSLA
jgi:hypothetical protein